MAKKVKKRQTIDLDVVMDMLRQIDQKIDRKLVNRNVGAFAIVSVSGGVAEVAHESGCTVYVLDWDNINSGEEPAGGGRAGMPHIPQDVIDSISQQLRDQIAAANSRPNT